MSKSFNIPNYAVIIKTNQYAGNFEREMCAFCTGTFGECEVGIEKSQEFDENFPENADMFEDIIQQVPDDHGCCRPVSIWQNKNKVYQNVAIYFYKVPNDILLEIIKRRAVEYGKRIGIDILGFSTLSFDLKVKEVIQ